MEIMGLRDWFSGRPSRERFAKIVIDAMRAAGEKRGLVYDPEQFCLRLEGESGTVSNLGNMYQEYCAAPRSQRKQLLKRLIQGWFVQFQELPDEFGDLHPDLLPVVRPRAYFEFIGLHGEADTPECPIPPYQVLGDYLGIGLVYDRPTSMQVITQRDLDNWHVTFYEALEAARENLKQLESAFMGPKEGPGTYVSVSGDSYDASRLVLCDRFREFHVQGEHVDALVLHDAGRQNGVEAAGEQADGPDRFFRLFLFVHRCVTFPSSGPEGSARCRRPAGRGAGRRRPRRRGPAPGRPPPPPG